MMLAVAISISGVVIALVVVLARGLEAASWRRSLRAYRLRLPTSIDDEQLTSWFTALAAATHRPTWSLLPLPPVAIEAVATSGGIAHVLLVSERNAGAVLSSLRAAVPGVRLDELHNYRRPSMAHAQELTLTSTRRPLATDRTQATSAALLSSLQPLPSGTAVVVQTILTSAGTPPPVKQADVQRAAPGLAWLVEGEPPIDAEAVQQLRRKYDQPLLHATLRVGVTGTDQRQARVLVARAWGAFRALNAPGVRVVRRYLPSRLVSGALQRLSLPLTRWPLLINARELVGLAALPASSLYLPGLPLGGARQLPAPAALPRRGLVIGTSNYPGQTERPLALAAQERLRHAYIIGPTGSGKSWLLANCILQDIAAGHGLCVVDVKGDLVRDVLARVAPADQERLLVINPTDRDWPVGLNILQHAGTDAAQELVVDNVLHIFREIWHGFWGPRSDLVMRSGLTTLTIGRAANGERLTLVELLPLLTDASFRQDLLRRVSLPSDLRAFWQRYNAMSDSERTSVIGPTLNKVDAFTSRTPIRLLLGQSDGVNLRDIFTQQRVVLVSLDKGALGAETTNLTAALIVSSLWSATLTQAQIPPAARRAAYAYLDEAQDIVRLEVAMDEMLAQARGYKLGIVLANQYLAQIPEATRRAILGTVRTTLCFQLDYDDARLLERRFGPLTRDDLQHLGQYEIALRPSVQGQTLSPVTGVTLPLPEITGDGDAVAARAAIRFGAKRTDVEAAMAARQQRPHSSHQSGGFGRQRVQGDDR